MPSSTTQEYRIFATRMQQKTPIARLRSYLTEQSYTLRQLLHIGTPIILGQLGIIAVNFADTMMVGKYSTDDLAAASFVNNIFALFFVLGLGFSYGLTPLVSKAHTRGDQHRLGRLLRHSTLLNLLIGIGLMLLLIGVYTFLPLFRPPAKLLPLIRPYFILQMLSLMVYMASAAMKQFFDGIGRTQVPMWIILSSNALNIFGNYLLIFGKWGFPALGLYGAGLSTLVARLYMFVALALSLRWSPSLQAIYRTVFEGCLFRPYFVRLFRLGLPVSIQTGVETAAWTFAIIIVTPLGEHPLAVHQILCTLTALGFLVYYGIGASATILVSSAHSRKAHDEVKHIVRVALLLSEGVALLVLCGLILGRHYLGYLFSDDPIIVTMTALAVLPMALYQPADALQVIYSNALRGLEDVKRMAIYACGVHLIIAPALCLLLGFGIGLQGGGIQLTAIWSAFPISLLLLGLLLKKRFDLINGR